MLVNTNLEREREREGLSRLEDPNRRVAKAKKRRRCNSTWEKFRK